MGGGARQPQVRLAELFAALSLGVDLGFGQPMEHVLRQCLIALRLADHAGLSEQDRVAVYYTALLVNVGCHSDAHEQAKWFGDDIKLKSGKYAHDFADTPGASYVASAPNLLYIGWRSRCGMAIVFRGVGEADEFLPEWICRTWPH